MSSFSKLILLALILFASCTQSEQSKKMYYQVADNPLFNNFNEAVDFKNLTPSHITQATDSIIAHSKRELEKLYAVDDSERTFENTMLALDDIGDGIQKIGSLTHLIQNTHPDSLMRNTALESITRIEKFGNEMSLAKSFTKQ